VKGFHLVLAGCAVLLFQSDKVTGYEGPCGSGTVQGVAPIQWKTGNMGAYQTSITEASCAVKCAIVVDKSIPADVNQLKVKSGEESKCGISGKPVEISLFSAAVNPDNSITPLKDIAGQLPSALKSMSFLYTLDIRENIMTGTVANVVGSNQAVQFDGDDNNFSGTISANFGTLGSNLESFSVSGSSFTGSWKELEDILIEQGPKLRIVNMVVTGVTTGTQQSMDTPRMNRARAAKGFTEISVNIPDGGNCAITNPPTPPPFTNAPITSSPTDPTKAPSGSPTFKKPTSNPTAKPTPSPTKPGETNRPTAPTPRTPPPRNSADKAVGGFFLAAVSSAVAFLLA